MEDKGEKKSVGRYTLSVKNKGTTNEGWEKGGGEDDQSRSLKG